VRIGIVSDTHNNLKNVGRIVELFNDARVDRVIHTGDITQAKTLDVMASLEMPMFGVYGNNDVERDSLDEAVARHGFQFSEPPLRLNWHGHHIVVVHDPLELELVNPDDFQLVLHGHTHRHTETWEGQRLTFNPGECAGLMQGYNAIGVLDLEAPELKPELIKF